MNWNLPKIILSFLLVLLMASPALASLQDDLNRNLDEQARLQKLINDAKGQENTLRQQIRIFDNQIKLTQLQIGEKQGALDVKESELASLNSDIGDLNVRIGNIETNLNDVSRIAARRFRVTQAVQQAAPIETLFVNGNFQSYASNLSYLEYAQHKDKELFQEMRDIHSTLDVQRSTLKDKQSDVIKLRDQIKSDRDALSSAKSQLDQQRYSRSALLKSTQNNESKYQQLLQQVTSEIASIQLAINGGGVKIGPVHAGDLIATQGNTGCSTGTHLHFGLYTNGVAVDPKPYLDSGYVMWPENNPYITQWFGENYWWYMTNFGMPGHNGIDMSLYYGAPIYAAHDGEASLVVESNACFLTGTRGKGIVIDHGDGRKTIYWHIR